MSDDARDIPGFRSSSNSQTTDRPTYRPSSYSRPTNPSVNLNSSTLTAPRIGTAGNEPNWLAEQTARIWQRLMSDPAFKAAWTIFLTHRLLLFALGAAFAVIVPVIPFSGAAFLRDVNPNFWGPGFFLLAPWQRWDTNWYLQIAMNGYDIGNGTTNFPPLFPFLVGGLGRVLFGQYMLAALLVSNIAYLVGLTYLFKLSQKLFNLDVAKRTLVVMSIFPSAFFMLCGYTESLFFALSVAAFYYAEEKRWYWAAGAASLACVTRLQGAVLLLPLAYIYAKQRDWNWRRLISWQGVALAAAPVSLLVYFFYVYIVLGDFNFNNHLAVIWRIKFAMPWEAFFGGIFQMFKPEYANNMLYNILDFGLMILFICLAIIWWQKKLPMAYLLYVVASMGVYLTRAGVNGLAWMSMARYLVVLFPCFMLLAVLKPNKFTLRFSAVIQAVWATLFIFWMWAG